VASGRYVFRFPKKLIDQPVTCELVSDYGLTFNILRANITPRSEGLMVLELSGDEDKLDAGVQHVEDLGVGVQPLANDVIRDEQVCTHCGACINVCPTNALALNHETFEVAFDPEQCVACELCVPVCPPRAMRVHF